MKLISTDNERRLQERHGKASELYVPDNNVADELFDGRDLNTTLHVQRSHELNERYRQVIVRRTCSSTTPEDLAPSLPYVLPLDIESIPGDYWSRILQAYLCQSPGYYNIKAACDVHPRIYETGPAQSIALVLLHNNEIVNTALDKHYFGTMNYVSGFTTQKVYLSGADKILLQAGDKLQLALIQDGIETANTGYYLTARFALQRTGDIIQQHNCTC